MGVAVLDIEDGRCHVMDAVDVVGKKLIVDKELAKAFTYNTGFCAIEGIKVWSWLYLKVWRPDDVVAERAFTHRFPQVLISLTNVLTAIQQAVCVVLKKELRIISPMQTKRVITGHGDADKDMVRRGILENTRITFAPSIDPQKLSEHCIDAIGHGYTYYLLECVPEASMALYLDSRPDIPKRVKLKKNKK